MREQQSLDAVVHRQMNRRALLAMLARAAGLAAVGGLVFAATAGTDDARRSARCAGPCASCPTRKSCGWIQSESSVSSPSTENHARRD